MSKQKLMKMSRWKREVQYVIPACHGHWSDKNEENQWQRQTRAVGDSWFN